MEAQPIINYAGGRAAVWGAGEKVQETEAEGEAWN